MSILDDRNDVKVRARKNYDGMEQIWPESDRWSLHTKRNIASFVGQFIEADHQTILNAGCGDNEYALSSRLACVNLDISMRQCRKLEHAVVADVEALPFPDGCFQAAICVGAVLNYAEPYEAIPELIRVTRPHGLILIDFETTHTGLHPVRLTRA
jgi:ubiquinone/menaquinone biosynthesis C-methylase UbiE